MSHPDENRNEETGNHNGIPRFPYHFRQLNPASSTLSQLNPRVAAFVPPANPQRVAQPSYQNPSSGQPSIVPNNPSTRQEAGAPILSQSTIVPAIANTGREAGVPLPRGPASTYAGLWGPCTESSDLTSSEPSSIVTTDTSDDHLITLVVMYKNSHFFLTVPLSIRMQELEVRIAGRLSSLGADQNIGDIIPERLAIQSLTVEWNVQRFTYSPIFPSRTIINDQNIEALLRFMKEKKTEYEVIVVETGGKIQDQTVEMEEMKKSGAFAR